MFKRELAIILVLLAWNNSFSQFDSIIHKTDKSDIYEGIISDGEHMLAVGSSRSKGAGSDDYLVVKYKDKTIVWEKTFGGPHQDKAYGALLLNNHYYVYGYSWDGGTGRNSFHIIKLTKDGDVVWKKDYGGKDRDYCLSAVALSNNTIVISGYSRSFVKKGTILMYCINEKGEELWNKTLKKTNATDMAYHLCEVNNQIVLTGGAPGVWDYAAIFHDYYKYAGVCLIKMDFQGNVVFDKTFKCSNHRMARKTIYKNDSYYIIGSTRNEGKGSFDVFVLKLNEQGDSLWLKTFGSEGFDYAHDAMFDDENLVIVGSSQAKTGNEENAYFLVINEEGKLIKELRSSVISKVNGIVKREEGFVLAGAKLNKSNKFFDTGLIWIKN